MYAWPGWDRALAEEIEILGHPFFFLSATAIEPRSQSSCSIQQDYGQSLSGFQEDLLLQEFSQLPFSDWQGATWPPNIVHRDVWDLVGGYSIEFSPGMYSDPDFAMKLWKAGVRYFKGLSASRAYHFGSVSVKRVRRNRGYNQFIAKWGMTSSTLTKYYLKRGEAFDGPLMDPVLPFGVRLKNLLKRVNASIRQW